MYKYQKNIVYKINNYKTKNRKYSNKTLIKCIIDILHLWRFKTPIFYNNLYINYYKNYLILL